jgi:hypothetical protein
VFWMGLKWLCYSRELLPSAVSPAGQASRGLGFSLCMCQLLAAMLVLQVVCGSLCKHLTFGCLFILSSLSCML